MTAQHALGLPIAEITPRTAGDILWLEKTLRRRYYGWSQLDDGRFTVGIEKKTGLGVWVEADTIEEAVAKARAEVEKAKVQR